MYDLSSAAFTSLLGVVAAAASAFGIWRMLGGGVAGSTPAVIGRRWMTYAAVMTTIVMLGKFFSQLFGGYGQPLEVFVFWIVNMVIWGGCAFAIGALAGWFRSQNGSAANPFVQPIGNLPNPVIQVPRTPFKTDSPSLATQYSRSSPKLYAAQNISVLDDDIYLTVAQELDSGNTDRGLWTRLFVECDGDLTRTEVAYIKARVEKLRLQFADLADERDPGIFVSAASCEESKKSANLTFSDWHKVSEDACINTLKSFDYSVERYSDGGFLIHSPTGESVKLKGRAELNLCLIKIFEDALI